MVRLQVHAKPRAKRSAVLEAQGLTLKVALAAPPVDGAANEALVELLAEVLEVKKRDVVLALGESSRHKVVDVEGLDAALAEARLKAAAVR
ncbi:MAG: DUF167 domain-containing protein [Myxococcaceae bacterium]|nr:DUF167 domain-containing protein [Myxococcaceae bacterium]